MSQARSTPLKLRVGDVVQVKSREEILATLTADGTIDGMPFMPEMLAFAGRQLTVEKRAHKTCDTLEWTGLLSIDDTVHLAGARCTGAAHGGCQAACQIFWKEAWLKKVPASGGSPADRAGAGPTAECTEADLQRATQQAPVEGDTEVRYRCQATDLRKFAKEMSAWNLMQFVQDIRSGNATVSATLKGIGWRMFRWTTAHFRGYNLQHALFNQIQRMRGGMINIQLAGPHTKTPKETLDLTIGERVQVKSVEEIRDTLNVEQRNRGLYFDKEMQPYCNRTYTVGARVTQIIEEKTGRMMKLPGDCIIMEGVHCTGRYHKNCPRASPSYFREIWLRRTDAPLSGKLPW
ncbi:MAG: hypothetical protein ABJF01_09375 [bacterium]